MPRKKQTYALKKSIAIAVKVNPNELHQIKNLALRLFKGNVSKLLREAALNYKKR